MTFSFNVGGLTPQDAQNQGGGGGTTVIETLSPKNIAGLICCFDGEINSREGIRNTAVNGMQNLMYSPYVGYENATGCREVLNGTPTFTAKGCKLGGTTFIPNYNLKSFTIEFVIELDSLDFNPLNKVQMILCAARNGGTQTYIYKDRINYQVFNSNGGVKYIYYPLLFEVGKKYHIAISDTIKKSGTTEIYIDGVKVPTVISKDGDSGVTLKSGMNIGFGGYTSSGTSSVVPTSSSPYAEGTFYAEHTTFYKFRMWNRQLSATEIMNNYNADVKALA